MMSKPYQLMKEDYPWTPEFTDAFESYDAAMDEAVGCSMRERLRTLVSWTPEQGRHS